MSAVFTPQRRKLSADQFERMGETGILDPEPRVELIEGEMIEMPPIGPLRGHKQASSSARYVLGKKETGITALAAAPVLAIAAGAPSLLWANRIG
jgi:hypothetical protein